MKKVKKIFKLLISLSCLFLFIVFYGSLVRNIEHTKFKSFSNELKMIIDVPAQFYRIYIKKFETKDKYLPNSLVGTQFNPNIIEDKFSILTVNPLKDNSVIHTYYPNGLIKKLVINLTGIKFINTDEKWLYQYSSNSLKKIYYDNDPYITAWEIPDLKLHHEFYVDSNFNISSSQYLFLDHDKEKIHKKVYDFSSILAKAKAPLYLTNQQFNEDGILHISSDGVILTDIGLTEVFINSNMENLIFNGPLEIDPYHLNHVSIIEKDIEKFNLKKNDLILSLRHKSMVAIYRPDEKKIIFYKIGPWENQHSVKFDHKSNSLYMFNNNVYDTVYSRSSEEQFFKNDKKNILSTYSFLDESVGEYSNCKKPNDIYSVTGGEIYKLENTLVSRYNNTGGIIMFCNLNTNESTFFINLYFYHPSNFKICFHLDKFFQIKSLLLS